MSKIIVRPAKVEDAPALQEIMNNAKNMKWLGGFSMLQEIEGRAKKQLDTGSVTLATVEVDGAPRVASEITPKDHYMKMGLVAVSPNYRDFDVTEKESPESKRQGYGSAAYTLHALRSALEGRLFLMDQIHWQNEVMKRYLDKHNFNHRVEQVQRVRNFCTLYLSDYQLVDKGVEHWLEQLKEFRDRGFEFQIEDNDIYRNNFEKLTKKYEQLGKGQLIQGVKENREKVLEVL